MGKREVKVCGFVACVLLAQTAVAQMNGVSTQASQSALPLTTTLPAGYPVLSLAGACDDPLAKREASGTCTIVVTRTEFENLVNAIDPRMTKKERRDLAENYAQVLARAEEARRRGSDKDPRVQALVRFAEAGALSNAVSKQIYRDSAQASEEQQAEFYREHEKDFERYDFERIFVPRGKQGAAAGTGSGAEMDALAQKIQARAVAGEDFAALQKEAAAASGLPASAKVRLDDVAKGSLPASQNAIFDLAPGKVSSVLEDETGYYIYKPIGKRTMPFEQVRQQVQMRMRNEGVSKATKQIESISKANIDAAYFEKYDPPLSKEKDLGADED